MTAEGIGWWDEWRGRVIPLLFVAAIVLTYIGQSGYDNWLTSGGLKVQSTYNDFIEPEPLSGPAAINASFGAREFLADIYWIELIQYYGGGDPYSKYRQLPALYNAITDLSPKFLAAYNNGLIVMPGEKFPNEAIALGEKGQKNIPDSWEVPYYEGLVYHIYKKDYLHAAKEFDIAATKKGALPITKYFAGLYYQEAGSRQVAYQIFQTVYQTTTDAFVKDRAKKQIDNLDNISHLESAVGSFQQKFHRLPKSFDELIAEKLIDSVPTSPLGLHYTYDPATGAVTASK